MNILYYTWHEVTSDDIIFTIKKMNYNIDILDFPIIDKLNDLPFTEKLCNILDNKHYDCIYTTDYFPIISKIAYSYNIKYISWSYDSNPIVLYSKTIFNDTNYIFTYDYTDYARLLSFGANNVFYLPLAVNPHKINSLIDVSSSNYKYDVSFVGNLKNDEYNFYDQISHIPEYYKGFFDCIINTQMNIYGMDLAGSMITDSIFKNIEQFINFNLDEELFITPREIFISFLQKKTTVIEREKILKDVSGKFELAHFAGTPCVSLPNTTFKGYADYNSTMPLIFNTSKINLNITLRSITTAIPLRCMDIMGAGGFLLSNYQSELAELFDNGVNMVMYESHEDALNKIEYYLTHDKERKEIATNAKYKIDNNFTYELAFKKIFSLCELT